MRHLDAGLATGFNEARSFRELVPDAVDLDVHEIGFHFAHLNLKGSRRR
jgi:hypothetical protein